MRLLIALLVTTTVFAAPAHAADPATRDSAPAEVAARSLWKNLDQAWGARDAAAFSRLFTDDGSLRFIDRDQSLEGRPAIQRFFVEQFSRQATDLRHVSSPQNVRVLAPDLLAVDTGIEILRVGANDEGEPSTLRTFEVFSLLHRTEDGWRFQILRACQLRSAPDSAPRPRGQ